MENPDIMYKADRIRSSIERITVVKETEKSVTYYVGNKTICEHKLTKRGGIFPTFLEAKRYLTKKVTEEIERLEEKDPME